MRNLSDDIEEYLKRQLFAAGRAFEVSRRELAALFNCVPSQINYVLATRFNPERGYWIESRRGGGGFIRITRLDASSAGALIDLINAEIGDGIAQDAAEGYIQRLLEDAQIREREAALMRAAVQRETIALELPVRDYVRANLLKAMTLALLPFLAQDSEPEKPHGGDR